MQYLKGDIRKDQYEMNILIIGSGAREHALAWKCAQSPKTTHVYVAPGNGGTDTERNVSNVDIGVNDFPALIKFVEDNNIEMTIVGPEDPLVHGIVDTFNEAGIYSIFGPNKEAARLEGSKVYAKQFMRYNKIPTSEYTVAHTVPEAKKYINDYFPKDCVVKADGLAAGKGAIVCDNKKEAKEAVTWLLVEKPFGSACDRVIIEERLRGREMSFMGVVSDYSVFLFPTAQDYKPLMVHNTGPNTGGMGSYSPILDFGGDTEEEILDMVMNTFFIPTVMGLPRRYKGFLYCGLMFQDDNPYLLEYNVRLGDPETQVLLPRMENDLVEAIQLAFVRREGEIEFKWSDDHTVGLVLASNGYPKKYATGEKIEGLLIPESPGVKVFHAGTKHTEEGMFTSGGRVMTVVGKDPIQYQARALAYGRGLEIRYHSRIFRPDIGLTE